MHPPGVHSNLSLLALSNAPRLRPAPDLAARAYASRSPFVAHPRPAGDVFCSNAEIRRIGERLLDHSLPRAEWTHAACCAAVIYFMREKPEMDVKHRMPTMIRAYDAATGAPDADPARCHETITQVMLHVIQRFLTVVDEHASLVDAVNLFLRSPFARIDYLLLFYSRERLFSAEARRRFVEPDVRAMAR